jgi:hypothetical protein
MKGFLTILAGCMLSLTAMTGCDNGLTNPDGESGAAALTNVRSAISDPVANCPVETAHYHDGVCYAGHYNNDGCSHGHGGETLAANAACTISGCTESGTHQHNSQYYGGHHGNDGCGGGSGHHRNGHE